MKLEIIYVSIVASYLKLIKLKSMRIIFLLLTITVIFTACSKDDDKSFIESLEGEYNGTYKTYDSAFSQTELSSESSTATLVKTSDNEIDVNVSTLGSVVFDFLAIVNPDSTFSIIEFTNDGEIYQAAITASPKMKILFGDEIATFIFEED
jgi:hypothetical protein